MNTFHIKGKIRTLFGTPVALKADFFFPTDGRQGLMEVSTLRCRSPSPNYNYHKNTLQPAPCDNLSAVALSPRVVSDDRQRQH